MKVCSGKKSVMFTVNFTDPRWSRCARDGIKKLSGFSQGLNHGGLSRARWSGNDEENSVPFESHQIVILSLAKNPRVTGRRWLRCMNRVHLGRRIGYSRF